MSDEEVHIDNAFAESIGTNIRGLDIYIKQIFASRTDTAEKREALLFARNELGFEVHSIDSLSYACSNKEFENFLERTNTEEKKQGLIFAKELGLEHGLMKLLTATDHENTIVDALAAKAAQPSYREILLFAKNSLQISPSILWSLAVYGVDQEPFVTFVNRAGNDEGKLALRLARILVWDHEELAEIAAKSGGLKKYNQLCRLARIDGVEKLIEILEKPETLFDKPDLVERLAKALAGFQAEVGFEGQARPELERGKYWHPDE